MLHAKIPFDLIPHIPYISWSHCKMCNRNRLRVEERASCYLLTVGVRQKFPPVRECRCVRHSYEEER